MKTINIIIFGLSTMILLNGCAVWKDLNTPVRKTRKKQVKKPDPYKPTTLPDGTTTGLNEYERAYIKGIDKDFEHRKAMNSRKVFGTQKR